MDIVSKWFADVRTVEGVPAMELVREQFDQ